MGADCKSSVRHLLGRRDQNWDAKSIHVLIYAPKPMVSLAVHDKINQLMYMLLLYLVPMTIQRH